MGCVENELCHPKCKQNVRNKPLIYINITFGNNNLVIIFIVIPRQEKLWGWCCVQRSLWPVSEQKQSAESSPPLHSSSEDTDRERLRGGGGGGAPLESSLVPERGSSDAVPKMDWMVKLEIGPDEHLLPLSSALLILAS